MLKIRLRKPGKSIKGRRHFKIVVCEARSARESRFVEQLGYYNPAQELLKVDVERYNEWMKKGARPTETVASLVKQFIKKKPEQEDSVKINRPSAEEVEKEIDLQEEIVGDETPDSSES